MFNNSYETPPKSLMKSFLLSNFLYKFIHSDLHRIKGFMIMFIIKTLNPISPAGLTLFDNTQYRIDDNSDTPDALLVRSAKLHDMPIPDSVYVIGRAGAGTNNIPVDQLTKRGIPVLNTPGANANAVKELVLAGMLMACRNVCQGWAYAHALTGDNKQLHTQVEQGKKQFVGFELPGKTLGVIGLGAIGVKVANAALALGMRVIGYDPAITVQRAWELSSQVTQAHDMSELLQHADFISVHVPLSAQTQHLISTQQLQAMKSGTVLLNFARADIIDDQAVLAALNANQLYAYVCDFPTDPLRQHSRVVTLPHLGASTKEAEENCARMIVNQVSDFLQQGNLTHSVNFPDVMLPRAQNTHRLCIANANIPNMVGQISTLLGKAGLNVIELLNKSRDQVAYTMLDVDAPIADDLIAKITAIDGVLRVRVV